MATVRRLILKGIGAGPRAQCVVELARPARLSAKDMERAMDAVVKSLGAKVMLRDQPEPALVAKPKASAKPTDGKE